MAEPDPAAAPFAVALTAVATYSPAGRSVAELEQAVASGTTGLGRIRTIAGTGVAVPFVATVGSLGEDLPEPAPPGAFPDNRQLRVGWAALRDIEGQLRAAVERYGAARVGLVIGTSTGGVGFTETALRAFRETGQLPDDYDCTQGHAMDAWGRHVATTLGIGGPVYAVSTACTSGAKALASARRLIQLGLCDAVLAGGVDSLCQMTVFGFHSLGVLSEDACRPFDGSSHGMNVSEGASLLLLERCSERTSEDTVVLAGVGESSDAHHMSAPDPSGRSQARAMKRALCDAGALPSRVVYVNAHGTGTRANDEAEALAIAQLELAARVTSTKGLCGHQLGAAGATEAVISRGVLRGASVSSVGELNPNSVPRSDPRGTPIVLSNSFAFGGSNICLAFRSAGSLPDTCREPRVAGKDDSPRAWEVSIERCAVLDEEEVPGVLPLGAGVLPKRAHARASQLTRLCAELFVRLELSAEEQSSCGLVVGSALGQVATTVDLIGKFMAGDSSPLAFQNSVHNAVAGALSLALKNQEASSSIAGGWASTEAALLEAVLYLHTRPELERVVVLLADETPPEVLALPAFRTAGCAFSLVRSTPARLGRLRIEAAATGRPWSDFNSRPEGHPMASGLRLAQWLAGGADAISPAAGDAPDAPGATASAPPNELLFGSLRLHATRG